MLEEACRDLSRLGKVERVRVRVAGDERSIWLDIAPALAAGSSPSSGYEDALAAARERTLLSGGGFEVRPTAGGGRALRAAWLR